MSTDAATPETPVPPDPDGVGDGTAVEVSTSDEAAGEDPEEYSGEDSGQTAAGTADEASGATVASAEADVETEAGDESADEAAEPVVAHVPAQAEPVHERTPAAVPDTGPGPVPDDAGGRLTARLREARARLQPEQTVIPAPRTPEGVVPPAPFGHGGGAPSADLLRAVDELAAQLAELEQDAPEQPPERHALLRALDRSADGVPDGGWSDEDRVDTESLPRAAELARTLHDAAAALLERLDSEERTGSAVEVDAVATALQVARMVIDLEAFTRHGR